MDALHVELKPKRHDGDGYRWELCRVRGKRGKIVQRAAQLLSQRIVFRRLPKKKAELWESAHSGSVKLTTTQREGLLAFLEPDFGRPGEVRDDDRLEAAVSEALWYELIKHRDDDKELLQMEGHAYSVTDPGGDGLVVYRTDDGALTFRLWEIKKHTGTGPVRDTATGAHRQLNLRALSYLARFSGVYQQIDDAELRGFYARLVDLWQERGPEAGVGVAVSATIDGNIDDVFEGLPDRFPDLRPRLEGLMSSFKDFEGFARLVRNEVWKGL